MEEKYLPMSNWHLIQLLIPYYRKNLGTFLTDLFCAALTTICELALPLLIAVITDTAQFQRNNLTTAFILRISAIYVVLRFIEVVARYYMQSIGHIMGARIERDMRRDVYMHLHTLSHSFFHRNKTGSIMARLTTDLFDITEFSHHCPEEFFIGAVKLMIAFFILLRIDLRLTLLIFALFPFLLYFSGKFRKEIRKTQMAQRSQIGEINANIEDSFLGVEVVKSFANEKIEEKKFRKDNERFLSIKKEFYRALAGFFGVTRIFDGLMISVILVAGGISLANGRISVGNFLAFLLYAQTLLVTLFRIVEYMEQFERGMTGLERFHRIMSTHTEITEKVDAKELENVLGEIHFDGISFHYPDHGELVLDDLNLRIPPGASVAIVGPSGGGKTTLSNLVPRFYDVTSGKITIDGVDIRDVTLRSLRENIGMVQQDVYLFNGSVRENIAYGKPGASTAEIIEAAKQADCYDFITQLPQGFETSVGQRGVRLSGGQKQRISIARVFLKNPPILILDEATSALDNRSEERIQRALDKLARGRTTITVAHRLSTIRNADTIIVLTDEGVKEKGTHEALMRTGGIYATLYMRSQETLGGSE